MLAVKAMSLDNSDPWAHLALGFVAYTKRSTDEAVEEFTRALDLNPNFAAAHGYLALALALADRPKEAITHGEQAILMSRMIRRLGYSMLLFPLLTISKGVLARLSPLAERQLSYLRSSVALIVSTSQASDRPVRSMKQTKRCSASKKYSRRFPSNGLSGMSLIPLPQWPNLLTACVRPAWSRPEP